MTALEIIRHIQQQHQGDSNRRGHMPGCRGGFWLSQSGRPDPCSELCRQAKRVLEHGDALQGALL